MSNDDANFIHWLHGLTEGQLLHYLILMKMRLKHLEADSKPQKHFTDNL